MWKGCHTSIRTIGLATGGGDCPGLNAVIRAVAKAAILRHGWRVVGIRNSFDGLIWPDRTTELTLDSVRGILPLGGTLLGTTNRGNPFAYPVEEGGREEKRDLSKQCMANMSAMGLDAIVVVGGEGTLGIAQDFARMGMPLVAIPKTIDHDLASTETTLGFDTALHVGVEAIDRLHTTADSHGRVMVLEVMGRKTGWIALHSGVAGGADVVLIPEIPFRIEHICRKIRERESSGRHFSIIVVAEGAKLPPFGPDGEPLAPAASGPVGARIAELVAASTRKEVRLTVLGHLQRGGSPSPFDRLLGTRFGFAAVELIANGDFARMVSLRSGQMDSVRIDEIDRTPRSVDPSCDHVNAARAIGISFGDGL